MKSASTDVRRGLRVAALSALVLVLLSLTLYQLNRFFRLDAEAAALLQKKNNLVHSQKFAAEAGKILTDRLAQLRGYEKSIPDADGYVWISKILHDATPTSPLIIDPPEISAQLVSAPEYCTGAFRVRGNGSVDDLLVALKKIEEELPFSRVQDLQIVFPKAPQTKTEFSFSLLAILRLNEEDAPIAKAGL